MKLNHFILIASSLSIFTIISACQSFQQKKSLSAEEQMDLISKGKMITQLSFQALSGELLKALQEGGVQNAVGYCHLQASPIIDSLSQVFDADINRVSDKYRNPQNKPDKTDIIVLDAYRQQIADGRELQPHLEVTGDLIIYYAPILIQNPTCLLCHGEPGATIEQENYNYILSRYPEDLATGYSLGDLRGVWKVALTKETK